MLEIISEELRERLRRVRGRSSGGRPRPLTRSSSFGRSTEGPDPEGSRDDGASERGVIGFVSFVVPTRNSARTIEACLRAIRAQSHTSAELIVVDNGSHDGTPEIARKYAEQLLNEGPERSHQRNVGAAASSGEFLVFIDSDMEVPSSLAREVVEAFAADARVTALVLPERSVGDGFWARCRILEKELYFGDPDVEAARAFRRAAFFDTGGFDEQLHGPEDWDLSERVGAAGGLGMTASFVLHDEGRLSLAGDLAKKMYYGRSVARYARRHPGGAARKLLRRAFIRRLPLLARDPVHASGLLLMKGLELGAVTVGMFFALVQRHPADRAGVRRGSETE